MRGKELSIWSVASLWALTAALLSPHPAHCWCLHRGALAVRMAAVLHGGCPVAEPADGDSWGECVSVRAGLEKAFPCASSCLQGASIQGGVTGGDLPGSCLRAGQTAARRACSFLSLYFWSWPEAPNACSREMCLAQDI